MELEDLSDAQEDELAAWAEATLHANRLADLCERGFDLLRAGEVEAAVDAFCALTLADDTHAPSFFGLGLALQHARRHAAALLAYEAALCLDPGYAVARVLRAECGAYALPREQALADMRHTLESVTHTPELTPYLHRLRATQQLLLAAEPIEKSAVP